MAFVGYRSEDEAAAALKYFNKSYLDTCRLAVEVRCAAVPVTAAAAAQMVAVM
jgi:hypothetical protein